HGTRSDPVFHCGARGPEILRDGRRTKRPAPVHTTRMPLRMMSKLDPQEAMLASMQAVASDMEALLERLLGSTPEQGETSRPQALSEAMRYASLSGGKRLRPFLIVESGRLFDVPRARTLMAGAALECVHCYSLVHDDLPAMDDDALRRGKPTVHKAY